MTDSDHDKTRLKKDRPNRGGDDLTSIASAKRTTTDKTRIAPEKNPTPDETRIAPTQARPAAKSVTRSQLRGQTNKNKDQTRFAPAEKKTASPDRTRFKPRTNITPTDNTVIPPSDRPQRPYEKHGRDDNITPWNFSHTVLKERFMLEEVLGAGGMGVVYKAKDFLKVEAKDRDPYVAIKVLSDEFKSHPEAFISLQRESRKSQRIAHPNIVNVYDFDRDKETVFMTMEYMEGQPLDQLIQQYKSTGLPTDDAWEIVKGMCAALIHAHSENIVHSDFKPGNVFVTNRGMAKVFDFGIARAVARVDHHGEMRDDKTLFDAGNLGALTPAYASLEMLEGHEPDVRDDIYALGCVVYEIFSGLHPYNRLPADEASKEKLKPKRISSISKRQWKVLEKALAFNRENRIETVDEFLHQMTVRIKSGYKMATFLTVLFSISMAAYFLYFMEKPVPVSEADIRNRLEYGIRLNLHKETIAKYLRNSTFTTEWEEGIWAEIQNLRKLLKPADEWLLGTEKKIYQAYIETIRKLIGTGQFSKSKILLENASRYTSDSRLIDIESANLSEAIQRNQARIKQLEKKKKEVMLARQKSNNQKKEGERKKFEEDEKVKLFELALSNVRQQMTCQTKLNMRNIDTAVKKLKSINLSRYKTLEADIIKSLSSCIIHTGKSFPERAIEAKKYAQRIFTNSETIAAIHIAPRDPCDSSIAGLGARGKRALCQDKIQGLGTGPDLVVVPASKSIKSFAIGKLEISVDEINLYCKNTSGCQQRKSTDKQLPATNMDIKLVKSYLKWLSKKTNNKYRLPTKSEWLYASESKVIKRDPNRNCKLSTRGIQRGEELVKVSQGKQNGWGLVNYIGNAQEWVYDKGRTLVAVGGSYNDPMENCDVSTLRPHTGKADKETGFRVIRELKRT